MGTSMEVNKLTYSIYKYLKKRKWKYSGKTDSKYIYLIPNEIYGLQKDFEIKLPISNKSNDFYSYVQDVLLFISNLSPTKDKDLDKLFELNDRLKHRFNKKWIIPEETSRIEKMNSTEIYLPK